MANTFMAAQERANIRRDLLRFIMCVINDIANLEEMNISKHMPDLTTNIAIIRRIYSLKRKNQQQLMYNLTRICKPYHLRDNLDR